MPILKSVRARVREGILPGGTRKNLDFYGPHVDWAQEVEETDRLVLADAQTSGASARITASTSRS